MVEKKFKKHILVTLTIIMFFIFVSGLIIGQNFGRSGLSGIEKMITDSELNTESFLIEQELMKEITESNCVFAKTRLDELNDELAEIGNMLSAENARQKIGDGSYDVLKRKFHLMQIRTYIIYYSLAKECDIGNNIVLFYYGADDEHSKLQGNILDRLVDDYDIKVFAIEYNYSAELDFLQEYYNITETPSIVLNYNSTFDGLALYTDIKEKMNMDLSEKEE